jgi:hydrogenase assembly chaperone HypC/HupF
MCIVAPARVLAVEGSAVVVDQAGRLRRASTLLVPDVAVDDWVVIGSGAVLRRLEAGDALELLDTISAAQAAASPEGDQP